MSTPIGRLLPNLRLTDDVLVLPDIHDFTGDDDWLAAFVDADADVAVPADWRLTDVEWVFARSAGGSYVLMALSEGRYVGTLVWRDADGQVSGIAVHPAFQRRGIATALCQLANEIACRYPESILAPHDGGLHTEAGDALVSHLEALLTGEEPK